MIYDSSKINELKPLYEKVLQIIGEDTNREGLVKTPLRVAKAMLALTEGYNQNADEILLSARFKEDYNKMVVVKDIEFYSLCEHHILPFWGKVHVAYIPNGYITGLSKLARIVNVYAKRLQVQEKLTREIKESIERTLMPKGVMVVVEAHHMCMQMRGVEKQESSTVTYDFSGDFNNEKYRKDFFDLIK